MDNIIISRETFFGIMFAVAFFFSIVGFLFGLVFDLKIRKRNRKRFDTGGEARTSMLDRPEKTLTKCLDILPKIKKTVDDFQGRAAVVYLMTGNSSAADLLSSGLDCPVIVVPPDLGAVSGLEKAKGDMKINRSFSNQALGAMRERNASSSWEKLRQVGQGIENGQMTSTTRQRLQEKLWNFQEQTKLKLEKEAKARLLPRRMLKEEVGNPSKVGGPEIKIFPNQE